MIFYFNMITVSVNNEWLHQNKYNKTPILYTRTLRKKKKEKNGQILRNTETSKTMLTKIWNPS